MGAKKKPFYRIVVKEKRSKRDGKYLENVGTYNPMVDPSAVDLKHDRIQYWISVGAQPTETVASLIKNNPEQNEEEKAAAIEARATKAQAEKQAKADAKKAEAEARKAEEDRIAAEKAAEEKAAADKAEAEKAEAEQAESENTETAETDNASGAPVEENPTTASE